MKFFNDPQRESILRTIALPEPTASLRIQVLCMLNLILSCVVRRSFAFYPFKSVFENVIFSCFF